MVAKLVSFYLGVGLRGILLQMVKGPNMEQVPHELLTLSSFLHVSIWGEARTKLIYQELGSGGASHQE